MQQWINEQDIEGTNIFKMSDFDFMPIGTKLIGDKIKDTPTNEPQQDDWTHMPLESKGVDITPSSPL